MPQTNPRILLIDDEPDLQEALGLALEEAGFRVLRAESGKSALAVLREEIPDLVLLDLSLPDINGLLLLDVIHGHSSLRHLPIVCLTGEGNPMTKVDAFKRGAVDYVTKPFRSDELIARIWAHVTHRDEMYTERLRSEQEASLARNALKRAEQRLNALVENSFDLVCELDSRFHLRYGSPNHEYILGYSSEVLVGKSWLEFLHPDDLNETRRSLETAIRSGTSVRVRARFRDAKGVWRWLDSSGSRLMSGRTDPTLLLVSRDITEEKEAEARLWHMALRDPLTGLGNRQMFNQELDSLLKSPNSIGRSGIILVDVDNFKLVNDTKGHQEGDRLLGALGAKLRSAFSQNATICRVGGDEFCILLRDSTLSAALDACERLLADVETLPYRADVRIGSLGVSLSAGMAMVEENVSPEELLSRADSALLAAKAAGKNRCYVYRTDSAELADIRDSATWYQKLRESLEHGRFTVIYQPIYSVRDGRISSWEALLRSEDESGNLHSPHPYLRAAERYQLSLSIDRFVIRRVLEDMAADSLHAVSINLSGQSVTAPGLGNHIINAFKDTGIDPTRVSFEITETVFMSNIVAARALVTRLQEAGCTVALDDFGAGFSSMNYLRNLPVNTVKIDGSFVDRIHESDVDRAVFRSINEIAHLLGKQTVAERVDSAEKAQVVREMGADYAQGFYYGVPIRHSEIPGALEAVPV